MPSDTKKKEEETLLLTAALASTVHEVGPPDGSSPSYYIRLYRPEVGMDFSNLWAYWVSLAQTFEEIKPSNFFTEDYPEMVEELIKETLDYVEEKGFLPTPADQIPLCLEVQAKFFTP